MSWSAATSPIARLSTSPRTSSRRRTSSLRRLPGSPNVIRGSRATPACWAEVPWITKAFIDGQRRAFASVPSKFKRLYENEWAAGDVDAFLTSDEINDAKDPALDVEPATLPAGVSCVAGLDLALNRD